MLYYTNHINVETSINLCENLRHCRLCVCVCERESVTVTVCVCMSLCLMNSCVFL